MAVCENTRSAIITGCTGDANRYDDFTNANYLRLQNMPLPALPPGQPIAVFLRSHSIKPSRQRLTILKALQETTGSHITPEAFHRELTGAGHGLSVGTVYNTLNQLTEAGLLRRLVYQDRHWFSLDPARRLHVFNEVSGSLEDIALPGGAALPTVTSPPGYQVTDVDVFVRVRPSR